MPPKKKTKIDEIFKKEEAQVEVSCSCTSKIPIDGAAEMMSSLNSVYGKDMKFPEELLVVWMLACELSPKSPTKCFKSQLSLSLVGPFEVLDCKTFVSGSNPHLHWRYFYDPPEFMTIAIFDDGVKKPSHIGYFRDDPNELPVLVATCENDAPDFSILGDSFLSTLIEMSSKLKLTSLELSLKNKLDVHGWKMVPLQKVATIRKKNSICSPFHGLGMIVPYDKKTEIGYRNLGYTVAEFKKILNNISNGSASKSERDEFSQTLTFVDVANDECDFGHGLEVGLDLFYFTKDDPKCNLRNDCLRILTTAYMLLNRTVFENIIKDHFAVRSLKKPDVELLE